MPLVIVAACSPSPGTTTSALKTGTIGPAGGSLTVTGTDDPAYAGTTISVPAGALTGTVVISIARSSAPVTPAGSHAAGPVVQFGPDGTTFASPVTIQIPLQLPVGASDRQVAIEAVEPDGTARRIPVDSVADGLAMFRVSGFTRFGCLIDSSDGGMSDGISACGSDADCSGGQRCVAGACADMQRDGGGGCATNADCPQCWVCDVNICVNPGLPCATDAGQPEDAGRSCTADSDCGGCPVVCSNGRCVETEMACPGPDGGLGCSTNADCPQCWICDVNICVPPGLPCPGDGGP